MTKKHVVLIVGLVLIAAIALINGLLFRVKTVTVEKTNVSVSKTAISLSAILFIKILPSIIFRS